MRERIKTIKWGCGVSLLFLALMYGVSVNIEGNLIVINTIWLPDNFFLTLFGGAFTGMLVVTLCETQKYLSEKVNTEQRLFCHGVYLYQQLMQMIQNIDDYIEHSEHVVPETLFDESIKAIQCEMNVLIETDYATFKQSQDTLMYVHGVFRKMSMKTIQPVLMGNNKLRIAINTTRIEQLKLQQEMKDCSKIKQASSSDLTIINVLNEQKRVTNEAIKEVDTYVQRIDEYCKGRYNWKSIKAEMRFMHISDYR